MIAGRRFGMSRAGVVAIGLLFTLSSQASGQEVAIRPDAIAGVRLCQPLTEVAQQDVAEIRDTTLASEGVSWPGKIAVLPSGGELLVEASWADRARIWRMSTDAPAARTEAGYGVGTTLGELIEAGEELEVRLPEGRVIVELKTADIAVSVEERFARLIWDEWSPERSAEEYLPRDAKITRIHVGGSCPR